MKNTEGKMALSFAVMAAVIIIFAGLDSRGILTLASIGDEVVIEMVDLAGEEDAANHLLRLDAEELNEKNITITNNYRENTLIIEINGTGGEYFLKHPLAGNSDHIYGLWYGVTKKGFEFDVELDDLYEFKGTMRDGYYYIDFADPHEIYDKVVVVDPGHGGASSPGTVRQGVLEADVTLAIGLKLCEFFEADESVGIYITRADDTDTELEERVAMANKLGADAFVSIHCNSTTSGNMDSVSGTEVLYQTTDESGSSLELAQILASHVADTFETENRGVINGDEIKIIRTSKVPVALVEVGFMSNVTELGKLTDDKYQSLAAEGIYDGIMEFLEE